MRCARRRSETSATPAATSQCSSSFPTLASSSGKKFYAFVTDSQREGKDPFVVCGHLNALSWLGGSWFNKGRAPQGFVDLEGALSKVESVCGASSASVHWQPLPSNVDDN